MQKTVENTERSRTVKRNQILPLTKLLATLTIFLSVIGLLGFTIFSGSSAEAVTEDTRPIETVPAAVEKPSVIAEQSNQMKDINIQTVQAVDVIDADWELQTQVADPVPVAIADDHDAGMVDIDLEALQRVKSADWLSKQNPQHYLIQLRSGTDYKQMNMGAYAVAQSLAVDPSQGIVVFPFKSNKEGQTVYGFGIGPYRNATAAKNAITEVPLDVKQHGTWIRRLNDLQSAVAELNSEEIGKSPTPKIAQTQLEQVNSASIETVVEIPQSDDTQQRNSIESIPRTETTTRDVSFWVESGVEETVLPGSALQGVATEQSLPVLDEQPVLKLSRDVTRVQLSPEIVNNQEGVVLEFQPLEFEEMEFSQ